MVLRPGTGLGLIRWIARFLLLAGITATGLSAAPEGIVHTVALGDKAMSDGQPDLALDLYRRAGLHAEGKPAVSSRMARAQLALAQGGANPTQAYAAVLEAWLAAAAYRGMSLDVRRGLAETYLGLGDTLAAAEQWETVYAADPSDRSLWYELAPAHLAKEEWAAAARAYDVLSAVDQENLEYQYWSGALGLLGHRVDPSTASARLALARADPAYARRASALLAAVAELTTIKVPAQASARLGAAFLAVGEPGLAELSLLEAVEQDPGFAEAWAYLGLTRDQLGKAGGPAIRRAVELAPDKALIHNLMGYHWLEQDRPDLARPEFVAAWRLDPTGAVAAAETALTYQIEGDLASAEAWYQDAVRRAPQEAASWLLLARFYLDTRYGDADAGLLAARRAVALAPDQAAALDTLGWAQLLSAQTRLAETNLLAARRLDPSSPAVHYHLGLLHAERSEWQLARSAFEQAVAVDLPCRGCHPPRPGPYAELAQRALEGLGGQPRNGHD